MLIENDREDAEELRDDDIKSDIDCDLLSCRGRVVPLEILGEVPLIV